MKRRDNILKSVDWATIIVYLLLIVFGWFSVCGASYDYSDHNLLDFSTRAGKQFIWMILLKEKSQTFRAGGLFCFRNILQKTREHSQEHFQKNVPRQKHSAKNVPFFSFTAKAQSDNAPAMRKAGEAKQSFAGAPSIDQTRWCSPLIRRHLLHFCPAMQ